MGVASVGGPERLFVQAPDLDWELGTSSARARVVVREGERVGIVLHRRAGVLAEAPAPLDPAATLADTTEAWRSWRDGHDHLHGPQRELVQRSVLTLQALTYQPTGALVAAATTSVLETPDSRGAWDYRFAWLRDASLVARALDVSHCADEGDRHFRFMARSATTCARSTHVQIVFGVQAERELSERTLDHLAGYGDGAPVRVGNAAWRQRQLDVLGEVLDVATMRVERHGLELEPYEQWFLSRLADRAAEDWGKPDAGLWELRDRDRHHTFSKVMCWVALDRAVRLARGGALGPDAAGRPAARWARERERIREAVLREAWDPGRRTLRGTLDGEDPWLDTAVLLLPAFGFLAADDPRMLETVARIREELGDGGLLRRSSAPDDAGTAFLICSGWLADCHARAGELDRAEEVLDEMAACANDLGLLAERAEFGTRAPAGNFPQALSHVGLVNASSTIRLEEEARAAAA
jgi:GH15 family glucan-1,4-alpha-glucosidase